MTRLPLYKAEMIASQVTDALGPHCERIAIAGSIRRCKPEVGDIDIVVLPRDVAALRDRVKRHCVVKTDGDQNLIAELSNGFQLDIWIARPRQKELFVETPGNWGTLYLCRTGSMQFNIWIADRARELGLHWNPYRGLMRGEEVIASETEEEIFKALKLDFVRPEKRERP